MKRIFLLLAMCVAAWLALSAADPTATLYSAAECEGSLTPYPLDIPVVAYPDTLRPVFINHVGRHGSRFPAGSANCLKLQKALHRADSLGTITPLGKNLLRLTDYVVTRCNGQWGALDSLGMAEQRSIASRMMQRFKPVFADGATVTALSSYSPRSMMSMFSFVHQLDRMNNRISYITNTGRQNSYLMRPFDTDTEYIEFLAGDAWRQVYDEYFEQTCPTAAVARVLGRDYPFENAAEWRDLAITEYYVLAGMSSSGMPCDVSVYFTPEEYNALWSCFNLRQYLQRTATTVSSVPAEIATDLALDLITTTDAAVEGTSAACAVLRFGHAETLLPLLSLLRLPGCYYLTNYFDTVALNWCDFRIVPMAANLQLILFRSTVSGRYYLRTDLNEQPVALIPGSKDIYVPWSVARDYINNCIPFYKQL